MATPTTNNVAGRNINIDLCLELGRMADEYSRSIWRYHNGNVGGHSVVDALVAIRKFSGRANYISDSKISATACR